MSKGLVSIIVPVYNVEKYLSRCIDAMIGQSYDDIEIILIDDGSKDLSPAICDAYADKDGRIKVFHNGNGGVSASRNCGIKNATGKWIMFVDSDDILPKNAVSILVESASANNAQYCFGGYTTVMNVFNVFYDQYVADGFSLSDKEYFDGFFRKVFFGVCSKLFLRKIIVDNNMSFDESITNNEDYIFNYEYLLYADRLSSVKESVYYYNRLNSSSLSFKYNKDYYRSRIIQFNIFLKIIDKYTQKTLSEKADLLVADFLGVAEYYSWHCDFTEFSARYRVIKEETFSAFTE